MENQIRHEVELSRLNEIMFAGKSIFTVENINSGNWFTYKVESVKKKKGDLETSVHFVSVLRGENNTKDYMFIGTIFGYKNKGKVYRHSENSHAGKDALSAKVIDWIVRNLDKPFNSIKIYHMGMCCKCGKELTTPDSIRSGIGPKCGNREPRKKGVPG
jgi:hypothetical protein